MGADILPTVIDFWFVLMYTGCRVERYFVTLPSPDAFPLTTEPELRPIVVDAADDRDPAIDKDGTLFFLSDREIERDGAWNIYKARSHGDDIPLTDSTGFDGQPAGGPVWWHPDRDTSVEWLMERQN